MTEQKQTRDDALKQIAREKLFDPYKNKPGYADMEHAYVDAYIAYNSKGLGDALKEFTQQFVENDANHNSLLEMGEWHGLKGLSTKDSDKTNKNLKDLLQEFDGKLHKEGKFLEHAKTEGLAFKEYLGVIFYAKTGVAKLDWGEFSATPSKTHKLNQANAFEMMAAKANSEENRIGADIDMRRAKAQEKNAASKRKAAVDKMFRGGSPASTTPTSPKKGAEQ